MCEVFALLPAPGATGREDGLPPAMSPGEILPHFRLLVRLR